MRRIQCLLENIYAKALDNCLEDSVFVSSFSLGFLFHPREGNVPPLKDPVAWFGAAGINSQQLGGAFFFQSVTKQKTGCFFTGHLAKPLQRV